MCNDQSINPQSRSNGPRARYVPQNYTDGTKWHPQHPVRGLRGGLIVQCDSGRVSIQRADDQSRCRRGKPRIKHVENAAELRNLPRPCGGGQPSVCIRQLRAEHGTYSTTRVDRSQCKMPARRTRHKVEAKWAFHTTNTKPK